MAPTTDAPQPAPAVLWLTDEQQRIWRSWLAGSARIQTHLDQDLRRHGLDVAEYEILVVLSEAADHEHRMSQLADQVHMSRSRLTHTIARMEKAGLVRRRPSNGDGRGVVAQLTDDGAATLVRLAPHHVNAVREVFIDAVDPDDLRALGRAMDAVLTRGPR